jgi:hypothetical protein
LSLKANYPSIRTNAGGLRKNRKEVLEIELNPKQMSVLDE